MKPRFIAIDGPSGVGKSTAAELLATRLGVPVMDTGAMYRALALAVLRQAADPANRGAVLRVAGEADIRLRSDERARVEVLLDGEPVEGHIRTRAVSEASSQIATYPKVRERMVEVQRAGARALGSVVAEGRDIGSVVFPETPYKFFLEASPSIRARRRYDQLKQRGEQVELGDLERELERRDRRDRSREASPLTRDDTYHIIDCTELGVEEVVGKMLDVVSAIDGARHGR